MSNTDDCTAAAPANGNFGDECTNDYIIIAEGANSNAFGPINFNRYN